MGKEKPDHIQHFVTCAYCGTQTQLSLAQFDGDRPVKCPACGAPLRIVPPPPGSRGDDQIKMKRDYGFLFADPWYDCAEQPYRDTKLEWILTIILLIVCIAIIAICLGLSLTS
jgi:DNA-directed RNA polymerase subunit RPC12/RpoP